MRKKIQTRLNQSKPPLWPFEDVVQPASRSPSATRATSASGAPGGAAMRDTDRREGIELIVLRSIVGLVGMALIVAGCRSSGPTTAPATATPAPAATSGPLFGGGRIYWSIPE